jgi:hypothetical protein
MADSGFDAVAVGGVDAAVYVALAGVVHDGAPVEGHVAGLGADPVDVLLVGPGVAAPFAGGGEAAAVDGEAGDVIGGRTADAEASAIGVPEGGRDDQDVGAGQQAGADEVAGVGRPVEARGRGHAAASVGRVWQ